MIELLRRHKYSTFSLIFYLIVWSLVVLWFYSGSAGYSHSDGSANGALVMFLILLIVVYSITLLILYFVSRNVDYLKIIGMVYLPVLLFTLIYVIGSFFH
jgi:hypothetical protein